MSFYLDKDGLLLESIGTDLFATYTFTNLRHRVDVTTLKPIEAGQYDMPEDEPRTYKAIVRTYDGFLYQRMLDGLWYFAGAIEGYTWAGLKDIERELRGVIRPR